MYCTALTVPLFRGCSSPLTETSMECTQGLLYRWTGFLGNVQSTANRKQFKIYSEKCVTFCAQFSMFAHCESEEVPWLQGEASLQTHSFRDADPQLVIPSNEKKKHGMSPMVHTSGINIGLTTTDPCLPRTAWQCSDVYHFRSSQLVD